MIKRIQGIITQISNVINLNPDRIPDRIPGTPGQNSENSENSGDT